eukprot:CAMPEP_0183432432 /NCGR_PEP_ID=MMETSP0370-20130417/57528_1 /TAXON_ID=268820 /ORGANISM="Peridinium aciculiferum, Strain PAER-2" /LENGTH=41 /DNA_ID= /DNA_START= /DNA_END= /DNA_ORIENTATION=
MENSQKRPLLIKRVASLEALPLLFKTLSTSKSYNNLEPPQT